MALVAPCEDLPDAIDPAQCSGVSVIPQPDGRCGHVNDSLCRFLHRLDAAQVRQRGVDAAGYRLSVAGGVGAEPEFAVRLRVRVAVVSDPATICLSPVFFQFSRPQFSQFSPVFRYPFTVAAYLVGHQKTLLALFNSPHEKRYNHLLIKGLCISDLW